VSCLAKLKFGGEKDFDIYFGVARRRKFSIIRLSLPIIRLHTGLSKEENKDWGVALFAIGLGYLEVASFRMHLS
jgi:hypothetical protein